MNRISSAPSRSSAPTLVLAVLACSGGTAGAAGLALEWLDDRPAAGWGVSLALAALVVAALAFALWAVLRHGRDEAVMDRLPTLVLAPEPHDSERAPPRVLRMVLPLKRPPAVEAQGANPPSRGA